MDVQAIQHVVSGASLDSQRKGQRRAQYILYESLTMDRPFDDLTVRGLGAPLQIHIEADNRREGHSIHIFNYPGKALHDGFRGMRRVYPDAAPTRLTVRIE